MTTSRISSSDNEAAPVAAEEESQQTTEVKSGSGLLARAESPTSDLTSPELPPVPPDGIGEPEHSAAQAALDVGESEQTSLSTASEGSSQSATVAAAEEPPPGRPHKSLLAGAAIAGALLIALPFLVSGEGDDGGGKRAGAPAGTVLGDGAEPGAPGAYESAAAERPRKTTPGGTGGAVDPSDSAVGTPPSGSPGSLPGAEGGTVTRPASSGARSGSTSSSEKGNSSVVSGADTATGGSRTASVPGVAMRSHASGRCISVVGGVGKDGSPLQISDCNGSASQKWQFMSDGTIRSMGLCMDLARASTLNGTVVQLATCNGGWAQKFRLNSAHDLVNVQADKCVDVKDAKTANGTRLQLWSCNGKDHQKWSKA
ncbi:ricin-type beta-trefoil lectin domain protein [Streptomyces sp. NPDC087659]|uniref:ricin-type beta-trefoil lectin domain protein n=1 Tax=Streptomyces sp. NPDC087659 TaxID=3365801 RepID=UPI003816CC6B